MKYYLAIDIGASSGRHIIGYKNENGELVTQEMYRFSNGVKKVNGHLTWDIEYLFNEILNGIKKCLEQYKNIESMSIDTWGVDYVLLDHDKEIMPCYAYRDNRCERVYDEVHSKISLDELFAITGIQFQPFNTIYQLYDDLKQNRLKNATDFLMMPEYFMYKLTGNKFKEYTNASTMGMLDANTNTYSKEIIDRLGLPEQLFKPLSKPQTEVGYFKKEIQDIVGGNIKVVLCPTHDTASAVDSIEIGNNIPYISSGTWSLLGVKLDKAITSKSAQDVGYSNEYGPSYIRFQKNIMGLWVIQCLAKQMKLDFVTMVNMARESKYDVIYDINDARFLSPEDMKEEILSYLKEHNMELPKSDADIISSTYHSLAYSYKIAIEDLSKITNKKYDTIYIVGGGAKNKLLNELCQKYTSMNVVALPIEATAIGNLKSQMRGK